MIVFAGIVPCSPLLVPSVNPEHVAQAGKTRSAYAELAEELFATHPDTIVLFCEHAAPITDSFAVNVADPYHAKLAAFGDLGYEKTYSPDFMLADGMQRVMRKAGHNITLITENELPFTATVPLSFITEHAPNVHILPIAPANVSAKEHFDFGAALQESLASSPKRIAILAAGDGSHTRSETAPGGLHPEGKTFDDLLGTLVTQKNTSGLLQVDEALIKTAQDASYRQIVMLFGVLDGMPATTRVLSQEAPFGVGQIVAEFVLN
jgi:aromatic ring-opening dioxygenase LigB subunit